LQTSWHDPPAILHYPVEVRQQMKKIESGNFEPADIDRFQELQWDYARLLVNRPLTDSAQLLDSADYKWDDPPCKSLGTRKDNAYKNTL
jgi:formylmethanofuran dehydrogenase subunit E